MRTTIRMFVSSLLLAACSITASTVGAQSHIEKSDEAKTQILDRVIAQVGRFKITRRQILKEWQEIDPNLPVRYAKDTGKEAAAGVGLTLAELNDYAFPNRTEQFAGLIENNMIQCALEEAAAQRHLVISEQAINRFVHRNLDIRRLSKHLPDMSDEAMATMFGVSLQRERALGRRLELIKDLVISDLADQLGHKPQPDDFYSAHMIYIPFRQVGNPSGSTANAITRTEAEDLRTAILSGKSTFEKVAKEKSADATAQTGGDLGVLPKTLLRPTLEAAILALKPGELTQPLRTGQGYAIFRLDKRGAELTQAERDSAVSKCIAIERRKQEAMARTLKDVKWSTTIGKAPEWFREMPPPVQ